VFLYLCTSLSDQLKAKRDLNDLTGLQILKKLRNPKNLFKSKFRRKIQKLKFQNSMKIYQALLFYIWFTLIIAIPPYWLGKYGHADWLTPQFWLIFIFLSGLTLLVLASILIVRQMFPGFFSEAFLAATTVKIIACLIFVLVFLSKNTVNKYVFLGDFFYIYFLNTAFEVYILLRTLRHKILR
jgi:hypothetical protein